MGGRIREELKERGKKVFKRRKEKVPTREISFQSDDV